MKYLYAALILGVLVLLAFQWRASAQSAARIEELRGVTGTLLSRAPRLNQEVLKLRASMSRNQDALVAALKDAAAQLDRAEALSRSPEIAPDGDLEQALTRVRGSMKEKEELSERVRSGCALLQNSLDYLVELGRSGDSPELAQAGLTGTVNDLIRNTLVYERSHDAHTEARIRAGLEGLNAGRAGLSPELETDLRFAEAHVRTILTLSPKIGSQLLSLISRPLERHIDDLYSKVSLRGEAAARRVLGYRDALFVAVAVLLLGAAGTALFARRRSVELERRVDQRTLELAHREAETRAILEGAGEGILSVEEDGTIRSANPAIERIFGCSAGELAGRPLTSVVSAEWPALRGSESRKREERGVRRDGTLFPLEILLNGVQLGARKFYSVILRDITQLRQAEQLKNEFISTVSHELRTPLTSIRGALGLVASGAIGALPPKAKGMVDIAAKNCERLVSLVSDILDIEKVASGKMSFKIRTLSLTDLVPQIVEANRGFAESLGVKLEIKAAVKDGLVQGDSDRLTQVLTNLISNACKFSPKGSVVTVGFERKDGRLRVSVQDRGPGIPTEFRSRIFQKFAQADNSDAGVRKGTGLGLAISQALIEKMNGTIGFETELGRGSVFHFELQELVPPAPSPTSAEGSRPRILVCEDERDIAKILKLMLDREGFDSDVASSMKEARAFLASGGYAGMTLDLALPDGNGISLIHEMRAHPATAQLPVIVVSANLEDNQQIFSGAAFGLVDWVQKPIPVERLGSLLQRYCKPAAGKLARVLHAEDDPDIAGVVKGLLHGIADVVQAGTVMSAWEKLKEEDFDLLILDIGLPDGSGLELLPALRKATQTPIPSLVFSAHEISPRIATFVSAALLKSKTSNDEFVARVRSLLSASAAAPKGMLRI